MSRKKLSRNTPCPCGSGKKYKHCCYGKGGEDDRGLGSGRQQPQYPIGTVAMYGPDNKTTTKIAAGVILHDGAEPILMLACRSALAGALAARPLAVLGEVFRRLR